MATLALIQGTVLIQVIENALNDIRVFNTPHHPYRTTALLADRDINPIAARSNTRFKRCAQVIAAWRSAGVGSSTASLVEPGRRFPLFPGVMSARHALLGGWPPRANIP